MEKCTPELKSTLNKMLIKFLGPDKLQLLWWKGIFPTAGWLPVCAQEFLGCLLKACHIPKVSPCGWGVFCEVWGWLGLAQSGMYRPDNLDLRTRGGMHTYFWRSLKWAKTCPKDNQLLVQVWSNDTYSKDVQGIFKNWSSSLFDMFYRVFVGGTNRSVWPFQIFEVQTQVLSLEPNVAKGKCLDAKPAVNFPG